MGPWYGFPESPATAITLFIPLSEEMDDKKWSIGAIPSGGRMTAAVGMKQRLLVPLSDTNYGEELCKHTSLLRGNEQHTVKSGPSPNDIYK